MGAGAVVLNMPTDEIAQINASLNALSNNPNLSASGKQKVKGQSLQIPAIADTYRLTWFFEKAVYITGIRYSQSAWDYEDSWGLYIDGCGIYETVYTKEIAEYKHFNRFEFVEAGTEIVFELEKRSGNSRNLWVDLEYLETAIEKEESVEEEEILIPDSAELVTASETIWFEMWDNDAEDNDTIDIYLNGNLLFEEIVLFKVSRWVSVSGLLKGKNILRLEGKNTDKGTVSCSMHIYEEDKTTKIINNLDGLDSFKLTIPVPHLGRQEPPYPFIEREIYRS